MEEIDPVQDRDEFVKRLRSIFCSKKCGEDYIQALLDEDTEKQDDCKELRLKHRASIKHYLDLYDAEETEEGKRVVVGSVSGNYDPTQTEIDSL